MKVFITGWGGFVGQRLVARLEARGDLVGGVDREIDVADVSVLTPAVEAFGPDVVVHLAARSSVADSIGEPEACFRTNVFGTAGVLAASQRVAPNARNLIIGSGDQYGPLPADSSPARECDPMRPRSPYARSKWAAEQLALRAAAAGQDVVCVRAFNHTGAGQGDHFVASSFARQIAEIASGAREAEMRVGNLESVRDFLDVEDVLDAYLALIAGGASGRVYNVASGQGRSIQWLLDTLFEIAQVRPEVATDPARFRPTDSLVGDASRLREETGWAPRRDFRDTLHQLLVAWGHPAHPPR